MRGIFLLIFISLIVAQEQELGVEEIKAKAEMKIDDAQKPLVPLSPDPMEPIDTLIKRFEMRYNVSSPQWFEMGMENLIKFRSPHLRVPPSSKVIVSKIRIPLAFGIKEAEEWELQILNSQGVVVANLSGKGKLPKEAYWEGIMDKNRLIVPEEPYTTRILATTRDGRKLYKMGTPFKVSAFATDLGDSKVLRVSLNKIFKPQSSDLQENIEDLTVEITNFIKENYRESVKIIFHSKDYYLFEHRARILRDLILKNVAIDQSFISFDVNLPKGSEKYEFIEFVVK